MKSRYLLTLGALVAPALVSACASFSELAASQPEYERLAQVHAGLTQDDVRSIVGRPDIVTKDRATGADLWIYTTSDPFNDRGEYDVGFDTKGVVTGVTALPAD